MGRMRSGEERRLLRWMKFLDAETGHLGKEVDGWLKSSTDDVSDFIALKTGNREFQYDGSQ